MMIPKLLLLTAIASAAILTTSCSITASLYPVEGPLAKISPLPVIPVKVSNVTSDSGPITLTMPNGEVCTGRWSVVAPKYTAISNSSSSGTISSGLDQAFVHIHGSSVTSGALPGINRGQAMVTGTQGTIMEVVFLVGSGTASGYGAAKDNRGNIYKLLF